MTPNPTRKRRNEKNTKRRRGEFEEVLFKLAKTLSKEKPLKNRKNPPHRSRKAIFGNKPDSNPKCDTPTRPKYHKLVLVRKKNVKNAIFKTTLSSAAPSLFFCLQAQFGPKIRNSKKNCKTCKNYFQTSSAKSRRSNSSRGS